MIRHGRFDHEFVRQVEEPSHVVVFIGSDHACCLKTRETHLHPNCSTVPHMPCCTSIPQGVIVFISQELEFLRSREGDVSKIWSSLSVQRIGELTVATTPRLTEQFLIES